MAERTTGNMRAPNQLAQLMRRATVRLASAGIEHADNEVRLLMAKAFRMSMQQVRAGIVLGIDHSLATVDVAAFDEMLIRRESREPLQYITGSAPFRFLDMQVGPGVFIPRPETECVVQAAIDMMVTEQLGVIRAVDLCAGSGAIGLSLLTELTQAPWQPEVTVWAVERSAQAAHWTARNRDAVLAGSADLARRYHLVEADACNPATLHEYDGEIDLIVSNPPYVPCSAVPEQPEVRDHDPADALFGGSPDGTQIPKDVMVRAYSLLADGGALVMEHDISQVESLNGYAGDIGFREVHTGDDLTGRPRFLVAKK